MVGPKQVQITTCYVAFKPLELTPRRWEMSQTTFPSALVSLIMAAGALPGPAKVTVSLK